MDIGRSDVALDVLAKRGDWDRLWEVAAKEKMATSTMAKFIIMRVEEVRNVVLFFYARFSFYATQGSSFIPGSRLI